MKRSKEERARNAWRWCMKMGLSLAAQPKCPQCLGWGHAIGCAICGKVWR